MIRAPAFFLSVRAWPWWQALVRGIVPLAGALLVMLPGHATAQAIPGSRGVDIVMIGDSITWAGKWNARFAQARLVNRAIPGYKTHDVLREMADTISLAPRKAVLMIGINDLLQREPVQETYDRYVAIVRQLQAAGIEVVMMATLECSVRSCVEAVGWVRELNRKLRAYAQSRNIPFIDINPMIADEKTGLLPAYTWDGLHLLDPAYDIWASKLRPYLQ